MKTLQYVLKNMVRQDQQWSKRLLLAQKDLGPDPIQPSPGAHLELEDLVTLEEFTLLKQVYLERIPYEVLSDEKSQKSAGEICIPGTAHHRRIGRTASLGV
ncbi:MAG: hypothetical protein PUI07_08985 [Clostridiales bacterium]|nr:hypothetical protein [Clostridiales bacterium]